MKNILSKTKSHKNLILFYSALYSKEYIQKENSNDISINIKFPMFLYKITFFTISGVMIRKHKRNLNSTITIIFKLSRNKIKLNFPFNHRLIKFN